INREYPEFPHRDHNAGDCFSYRDPHSVIIRMTGDDSPSESVYGIYHFGSDQVHGADIPKKEQLIAFGHRFKVFKDPINDLIWLPTQAQLQEMVGNSHAHELAILLVSWLEHQQNYHEDGSITWKYPINYDSMESLWLAFVMYELYSKIWNGEDWVNI
ncbi:hypothetical protein LCGC14_2141330, partial [marine sediment metagenome]